MWPLNRLFERFNMPSVCKFEMLGGIVPESSFHDKSRDSSSSKLPILSGIVPDRSFLDKFKNRRPWRYVSSSGISPVSRLLDKSIPVINSIAF
jgi:hypothetical protein